MTKRLKHKYKICRQVGEDIWGKFYKNIKLSQRPGQHGITKRRTKELAYIFEDNKEIQKLDIVNKRQLIHKIRKFYSNISSKQFNSLLSKSKALYNNIQYSGNNLTVLSLLEQRLDTIVYRINWASSFYNARMLISHGHILVNGSKVYIPSYIIQPGDMIQAHKNSYDIIKNTMINNLLALKIKINTPNYIEVNYNTLSAIFIYVPRETEIPYPTLNIRYLTNLIY